jgi:hypothetical protein
MLAEVADEENGHGHEQNGREDEDGDEKVE